MQVFRDYRLIECETTMRRLTPIAIREVAVFDTEEVVPVVHAHWERKRMLTHDGELYCSNCEWTPEVIAVGGTTVRDLHLADVYYCPHCGAIMDEAV